MVLINRIQDSDFVRHVKEHPRYQLRVIALIAVAAGIFFNILAIAITHEKLLCALAFLPLCISMVYNLVDLFLRSLSEKDLSQGWIVFVDTLGFLSFLALLIANGIVASHGPRYHEGHTFLLAYSSVPWLISCSIHGLILLKEIPQMLITDHARHICTNCGCDTNTTSKKPINRSHYSQVVRDYDPKEDVENNAPSKIGNEPSPTRESLESTNENSRLFTSSGY